MDKAGLHNRSSFDSNMNNRNIIGIILTELILPPNDVIKREYNYWVTH